MDKSTNKQNDIEELKIVKKILIEVSKNVYRDLEFFYQSENKPQRRKIYNRQINYDSQNLYGVICKTLCEIVKEKCKNEHKLDIELISCDTDEFGHVDLLLTTKNGNKYIINCLSDLERIQMEMKTTRFATEEYFDERYIELLDKSTISFLSEEENMEIDKSIGYCNSIYMDDFFNRLKVEFNGLNETLKDDETLRKILLGEEAKVEDVEKLSVEQLTNIKLKFLLDFCNQRAGLIGHIELIRIYKILSKELFLKDELKKIQASDCFFDKKEKSFEEDVWNVKEDRVRFLKLKVGEDVYLLTTVNNTHKHMNIEEYENFKNANNVYEKAITRAFGTISETIRNKGVGVNILKHTIVDRIIKELDNKAGSISKKKQQKILKKIQQSDPNNIDFQLGEEKISIELGAEQMVIVINGEQSTYSFKDDNLVKVDANGVCLYVWKDEGEYDSREMPNSTESER